MDCDDVLNESFDKPSPEKKKLSPPPKKKRRKSPSPQPDVPDPTPRMSKNDEFFQYQNMEVNESAVEEFDKDKPTVPGEKLKKPAVPDPDLQYKGLHKKDKQKQKKKDVEDKLKKDPRGEDWYENPHDFDGKPHSHPDAKRWQCTIPQERMAKFSPGMRALWTHKSKHWDGIMLYKCGKFYEIYLKDAEICADVLHLNLMNDDIPHVGFPETSIDKHIETLVTGGYKIYRVEEMESLEEAKERTGKTTPPKLRDLCSAYTPGTYIGLSLEERYTFSICEERLGEGELAGSRFHLVWLAASSCDFFFDHFDDDRHRSTLRGIIAQYMPTEVLHIKGQIQNATLEMIRRDNQEVHIYALGDDEFYGKDKIEALCEEANYFGDEDWPEALTSVKNNEKLMKSFGGILSYLKRHLLDREFMKMRKFQIYDRTLGVNQKFLTLDRSSIDNLHIFQNDYGLSKGTLFRLIDHCCTLFGARLLKNWLRRPLININDINLRQDAVTNLLQSENMMNDIRSYLVSLPDMMNIKTKLCRISVGRKIDEAFFHGTEFAKLKVTSVINFLRGMKDLISLYQQLHDRYGDIITSPRLQALTMPGDVLWNFKEPIDNICRMFDYRAAEKDFVIRPGKNSDAKKKWDQIGQSIRDKNAQCQRHLKALTDYYRGKIKKKKFSFKAQTAKDQAYQVNITAKMCGQHGMPDGWKRLKGGISNDELESLGIEIWRLKNQQLDMEANFACTVYAEIAKHSNGLDTVIDCVAELDCLLSLARVSQDGWCAPKFVDQEEPIMELKQCRHPCVSVSESMSASKTFIPNDVSCGGAGKKFVVVTGPNMGGKSTILRQVCIIQILAQLGCYVPAEAATLSPVDRIFTRIGANDNILAGQSTFMVELEETSTILKNATRRSLVILDELGRGTSTYDGAAIAYSVAEHVTQNIGCRTMFSTHYHRITQELATLPDTDFYHMAFRVDEELQKVVFLYKFAHGLCNVSHGVNCARLANIPMHLINQSTIFSSSFKKLQEAKNLDEVFDKVLEGVEGEDLDKIFESIQMLGI